MKRKLLLAALCVVGALGMRAQTDVTSTYITNAGFDTESDFQTSNVATGNSNQRKAVTGWTNTGGNTYTTGAAIGFGTSGQINGANLPSTNADGSATGGALCLNAAWTSQVWYSQDVTLPAGNYTMEFAVNNVGQNAQFEKDPVLFSFTTTTGASFSGNVHSYPVNTWTTQTITFALASETQGVIKIGYKATNKGSGDTPKLIVDYVKAFYNSNYTETLQSTIDRATILNARASDADLAAAITTAQGVLEGADNTVAYQTTIDNAVTTLRSAISTAAAKVILLEGENITFMLENADFESSTPVTVGITTYDYDAASNGTSFSRMQVVEGWTIAENGNAKSAGVFEFGQTPFLGSTGTSYQAPSTASATGETKALGIVAVWSSSAQYKQAVTFPAGSYIIEVPVYNTAGTTAFSKNLIGFVEDGGTEHLATAKTYTTGSWITEKVIFELENETSGYMSLGYTAANAGSGAMPHLFIDNVKVTYTSPIAAAYQKYQDALEAANTAIANTDYDNVTGSERTALQSAIDATPEATKEAYNNAADALDKARETFTAAKSAYDAFVAAKEATTVPDLSYAAAAKKTTLEEAIAATATSAEEATTKTAAITTALRAYYESHAKAEGVEEASDCADAIAGAVPETNTGWTGGIGVDDRAHEKYTDASGSLSGKYYDGGWATNAGVNINMSREIVIPAGKYLLTVTARGSEKLTSYQLAVGEEKVDLPMNGSDVDKGVFGHGWDDVSLEFTTDGNPVTLAITAESTEYQQWISFNRFRLVQLELNNDAYAGEADYAALNAAIEAAEAKTLGFAEGEYAPYNNVAALKALAEAKAIDQTAELTNFKTTVNLLTETLNATDSWTANGEDVDAIYNGSYATVTEGANYPDGWTRTNPWGQMLTGLAGTYTTAYYNQPGSLKYGETGVYTMPLAANTWYKLTFAYRSHENNSNNGVTVSVLNGKDGLAATTFDGNASTSEWKVAKRYFTTGAAGNYVLTLANDGNTWMTGVSLEKEETPANIVKTSSTNLKGYKTFYNAEFNYEVDENTDIYIAAAPKNGYVSLTKVDADRIIPAGTPVILKTANQYDITLTPTAAPSSNKFDDNVLKVAETTGTIEGAYILAYTTANRLGFYQFTGSLNAGDVYLTAPAGANVRLGIIADGEATGIAGVDAEAGKDTEVIYNMAGQRVDGSYKGIVIKNGKKILVK